MCAHPLFPQIPQGLLPVVVKECEHLCPMIVVNRSDILSQLQQSDLRLGFTVRMVEKMHQLPNKAPETLAKPLVLACQCGDGLLFLRRQMDWFLQETPTSRPQRLGQFKAFLSVLGVTLCLDPPTVG